MRFDDTLETVLAADVSTAFGKVSAWRQLVDLIGRRRIPGDPRALVLLESLRGDVPVAVRITSARALEMAEPPAELVKLCAVDDIAVAAPILRTARLDAGEWIGLLPRLSSSARGVLRGRRDLPQGVEQALDGFRAADFVIGSSAEAAQVAAAESAREAAFAELPREAAQPAELSSSSTFVPIGVAAMGIPVVAAALQQAGGTVAAADAGESAISVSGEDAAPAHREKPADALGGPFEISEVVARIDAFYTRQQDLPATAARPAQAAGFRFETDAQGAIRWVDGVSRAPLIGLSLDMIAQPGGAGVDGVAAGAFRQRTGFAGARLMVAGESDAGGEWRISASAAFDPATGRFSGYRGVARRPRNDEIAGTQREGAADADSLRQLMHELRTPTNAIAGFAELIEREILGEAAPVYRGHAATIREHARALLAAIDDLDIAARIDAAALRLYPGEVALGPLLTRIGTDLEALAATRGAALTLPDGAFAAAGDTRAIERLLSRMLATLLSAAGEGERIGVELAESGNAVVIRFDRPRAFADHPGEAIFAIDDEREGAALLGTGFALRLIRNLARELSGALVVEADSLAIRLPAAVTKSLEQAR